MVRVEGETWRATTAGEVVELGTQVMVKEVRGTRLVVVPQSE
jgi:membrane protein implicated in regulation of membrane protease activity